VPSLSGEPAEVERAKVAAQETLADGGQGGGGAFGIVEPVPGAGVGVRQIDLKKAGAATVPFLIREPGDAFEIGVGAEGFWVGRGGGQADEDAAHAKVRVVEVDVVPAAKHGLGVAVEIAPVVFDDEGAARDVGVAGLLPHEGEFAVGQQAVAGEEVEVLVLAHAGVAQCRTRRWAITAAAGVGPGCCRC